MVENVVAFLKPQNRFDFMTIQTHLSTKLPLAQIDANQIQQVLVNLVDNAAEALLEKSGERNISVTTSVTEINKHRAVKIEIRDNGSGVPADKVGQLFNRRFTTKEKGKGTGLGLSIVYSLVEQMGGWIEVYSEPGNGATFRIFIPQTEEEYVRDVVISEGRVEDGELAGRGERILLVEDEEMVRRYTANVLRQNGYEVVEASRSKEALEIFKRDKGNFDVILSDGGQGFSRPSGTTDLRPTFDG